MDLFVFIALLLSITSLRETPSASRSLAVIIGAKFFGQFDETTRNIFALLAFAAGFLDFSGGDQRADRIGLPSLGSGDQRGAAVGGRGRPASLSVASREFRISSTPGADAGGRGRRL